MHMKRAIITVGLLAITASGSVPAAAGPAQAPPDARQAAQPPSFKKLTRAEFDALLAKPASVLVIDVRRPDELTANGGFPVYLSIQAADLEKSLAFIPKDRAIVTVSNRAARAGRAAALLSQHGFTVAGGIGALEYEAEGGTLAKITAPAPRGAREGTPATSAGAR